MNSARDEREWWLAFYDDLFFDVGNIYSDETSIKTSVDFLTDVLQIAPGAKLLDQCCGAGRLSIPLARRGFRVTGVDSSEAGIRRARAAAQEAGATLTFHQADAREFVSEPVDGAFNLGTSCGYSDDDAVNARMFRRAFESLRAGGRFVLEYTQIARVLNSFQPGQALRKKTSRGDYLLVYESEVNLARGMFEAQWTAVPHDGPPVTRYLEYRLWLPSEIAGLLRGVGFTDIEFFGSSEKGPLTLTSGECLLTARKP